MQEMSEMSRKLTTLLSITVVSISVGVAAEGGTVIGWVFDRTSRNPIVNATISVDSFGLRTATDSQGFYSLIQVPTGYRTIRASAAGHVSFVKSGVAVIVIDGGIVVGFNLGIYDESRPQDSVEYDTLKREVAPPPETLQRDSSGNGGFCTVTGEVLDSTSWQPLGGASVEVEGTELGAVTDDYGEYHIDHVPSGSWTLSVCAVGYRTKSAQGVRVARNQKNSVNFRLVPTKIIK